MDIQKFMEETNGMYTVGKGYTKEKYNAHISAVTCVNRHYFNSSKEEPYTGEYYRSFTGSRPASLSGFVGPLPLDKFFYIGIDITVPKDQTASLVEGIYHQKEEREGWRHYKDEGLWYTTRPIEIEGTSYLKTIHPAIVKKKPWFDEVLKVVQKHDPNFTEEDLIDQGEHCCGGITFNKSVVENIIPERYEYDAKYDRDQEKLSICCMNNDIPKYRNKLLNILSHFKI